MADTTVDDTANSVIDSTAGIWGPYWISETVGVIIQEDATKGFIGFQRTDDGGATWAATVLHGDTDSFLGHTACWFDQETPGDTGNLVHVVWMRLTPDHIVLYRTVDISDGSIGTLRTIDSGVTVASSWQNEISITKTRNGNLLMAFSTQTEVECYRSTDSGATWTDRSDPLVTPTEEDHILLFPANTADDADACAVFWDRSTNNLGVKMYDDSANSWTPTAALTSMVDDAVHINMDATVRHSDGFILVVAHSDDDTTTDDLRTFTLDPDSISSPTIDTTTANVFTNEAESAQCTILVNQQNDDVYVAWLGGGTWQDTVDVVYKLSVDDMASWGSEQAYSEAAADDLRRVHAGRTIGNGGGFFQPCFFDFDDNDVFVNLVNDVAIAAIVGGAGTRAKHLSILGVA